MRRMAKRTLMTEKFKKNRVIVVFGALEQVLTFDLKSFNLGRNVYRNVTYGKGKTKKGDGNN